MPFKKTAFNKEAAEKGIRYNKTEAAQTIMHVLINPGFFVHLQAETAGAESDII